MQKIKNIRNEDLRIKTALWEWDIYDLTRRDHRHLFESLIFLEENVRNSQNLQQNVITEDFKINLEIQRNVKLKTKYLNNSNEHR